jgi:Transposase zinc-binding domain
MSRPAVEVADILRAQGSRFLDRYESSFDYQQLKAFRAIQKCRTAALGGHLDSCSQCGRQAISYNSCRNRHCPKCQTQARERWITKREQELLSTSYFHVVFTVPHELNVLALNNPRAFLRAAVPGQRCVGIGTGRRSETSRRRDWHDQHPPYVGTESAVAPSRPLRDSRRRPFCRSRSLGSCALSIFPAGEGVEPCFSRQVCRRPQTPVSASEAKLFRPRRFAGGAETVHQATARCTPARLGRLREARLRWSLAGAPLSWQIHPSSRYFQS